MKLVSRFAMVVALVSMSMTSAVSVSAADDKPKKEKKGKKDEAPAKKKLSLSKEFEAAYNPVVKEYVKTKDAASAAAAKTAFPTIKAAIMNEDDRYQAGTLAQDISLVLNDIAFRKEAMELLIASTSTPPAERGIAHYLRGAIGFDAKDWQTAITHMQKSYELGFRQTGLEGGLEILVADSNAQLGNFPAALEWLAKSEEGSKVAGAKPLPANFDAKAANYALKTKSYTYIGPWMQKLVRRNPTADYWHDALMQTDRNLQLDSQETLDLMRLLRSVKAMKYQQNYSAYATDSIAAFFPTEVKGLLEEGFASGTISKNTPTYRDLYTEVLEKLKSDPFSVADLDKDLAAARTGFDATITGDMALSVGEYARAKAAYEAALTKGNLVDREGKNLTERTTMRLGMAKLKLGDLDGARAEFAKMQSPGRKAVAEFWTVYADQLSKAGTAPAA